MNREIQALALFALAVALAYAGAKAAGAAARAIGLPPMAVGGAASVIAHVIA